MLIESTEYEDEDEAEIETEDEDEAEAEAATPTVRRAVSSDKFRYKLLRGPWDGPGTYVRVLNSFGKLGWEVVQVHYAEGLPKEVLLKMWLDESES